MSTENELLQQIKESDKKAFELLFRLYYQPLKKFAAKLLNNTEQAEDLVQEVFVQFWESRNSIKQTALKSYFYTIVKNKALNQLRHLKVQQKHIAEILHTSDEFIETEENNEEVKLKLLMSIEKLPTQCKKVFIMSRMDGLKQKEIAEELNISVKTVKNQIGKALKVLREELKVFYTLLIISILKLF